MALPAPQQMLDAIQARDSAMDERFFYGVITTGIFCRPSCGSRLPRAQNLRFFDSVEAAMRAGYRPCKRCRPCDATTQQNRLEEIARYIESHADERLTLSHLASLIELSPSRLQRVFKNAFGVSPKQFQDGVRMERFKQGLKKGNTVTDAIYNAGYGSISRVYGEDVRNIGMTPAAYSAGGAGETISYVCRDTALGPMMMAATRRGVCCVHFAEDETQLLKMLQEEFPQAQLVASPAQQSSQLDDWIDALDAHIGQGAPRPDVPLDLRGTAFQIKVWRFLLSVREGDIISYGEIAGKMDKPRAFRAVANACGANRVGVLVPCHRVIRGDGNLGGYRWGLHRKRTLLDRERCRKHPQHHD